MVAVVVGSGLGLEQTSGWVLGSRGQLGQSSMGRAGENVLVNAANGNLIVTRRDEFLVGQGPDAAISRTYNSLGALNDDNGDNWRAGVSRRVWGLTGTINTVGSTVKRTDWDGSEVVYTWSAGRSAYVTTEGAGSYDTLALSGNVWTWTDGTTRIVDTYSNADDGRITSSRDLDGRSTVFAYNTAGLVSKVTTSDGSYTELLYEGTNLVSLVTTYKDTADNTFKTLTRIRYAYDTSNRLKSVTLDLSPNDNITTDGNVYVTTYTYDGASRRIASIAQTDGSRLQIDYDASGRVVTLTQAVASGVGRTTTFSYGTNSTTVSDHTGAQTTLAYNAAGRLLSVTLPAATIGATPQQRTFTYNANGDVTRITDAPGVYTDYLYDDNGNRTIERDRAGNTVRRWFGAANQLLAETRFQTADSGNFDPSDLNTLTPSNAQTTRYIYDVYDPANPSTYEGHLRYVISATGRVTRYEYSGPGNRMSQIEYTARQYNLDSLSPGDITTQPDLRTVAQMDAWVAGIADKTRSVRIDTDYDFRGNVVSVIRFGTVLADGSGDASAEKSKVFYVYDQSGNLLTRQVQGEQAEVFVYDGLNRITSRTDVAGAVTRTYFRDTSNTTVVTLADGLTQVSVHNAAGELISYSQGDRADNLIALGGWPEGMNNVPAGYATLAGWINTLAYVDETQWVVTDGPNGENVIAIKAGQDPVNTNEGGGNVTNAVTIDGTKAYEFTYYFRKYDLTRHSLYFGLSRDGNGPYVENLSDGSDNPNPYFYIGSPAQQQDQFEEGRWYKVVGYVLPENSPALVAGQKLGGIFDAETGEKVADTNTFRWNAGRLNNQVHSRFFIQQDGALNGYTTRFYKPEIRQVTDMPLVDPAAVSSTTYRYDSLGRLRFSTDPTGDRNHVLYDRVGRKVADIDADGSLVEYRYDLNDRLTTTIRYATALSAAAMAALVDAAGNPVDVVLGTTTNGTTIARPTASVADSWTWHVYDNANRLIETIGPDGAATEYTYDGLSQLIAITAYATRLSSTVLANFRTAVPTVLTRPTTNPSDDRKTRYFYNADGQQTGTLDAEGYLRETEYDHAGRVIRTIAYANDVKASPLSLRNSGSFAELLDSAGTHADDIHQWSIYDGRGFLVGTVNGEGEVTLYSYTARGYVSQVISGRKLATVPTTQPTLVDLTNAPGTTLETTLFAYNQYGQVVSEIRKIETGPGTFANESVTYTYDARYRLIATSTNRLSGNGTDFQTRQRYDFRGRLIGQLGGEGTAALLALYAQMAGQTQPTAPTEEQIDELYAQWGVNFTYDDADRLISRTEPNGVDGLGNRTLYFYDTDGALAYEVDPLGGVTGYLYDAQNRLVSTLQYAAAVAIEGLQGGALVSSLPSRIDPDASASVTTLAYDTTGTIQSVTTRMTATEDHVTQYSYSAFGERLTQIDPIGTTGASTRLTTFDYDRRGLLTQTVEDSGIDRLNRTTILAFDAFGREIQSTDPRSFNRYVEYDRAGRIISRTDGANETTDYSYDARGNVISVTDPEGHQTTFAWNPFNRELTATSPEGLTTTTTYNDQGQTLTTLDGEGRTTTYVYDRDGALTQVTNGLSQSVTTNTYDEAGRLETTTDGSGVVVTHTYDAAGRLKTQTVNPGGANQTSTYEYDVRGRRIAVIDGVQRRTEFKFDLAGRQTEMVVDPLGLNIKTTYARDRAGYVVTVTEAAGSSSARVHTYTYDALGRRISEQTGPASLNIRRTYVYDANGNVTRRLDGVQTGQDVVTLFAYDAENRQVATVNGVGAVSLTVYDAAGRVTRTLDHADTLTPLEITNLGSAPSEATIVAAVTANPLVDRSRAFVYDDDNRLVFSMNAVGQVTERIYDDAGNVVRLIAYEAAYTASLVPDEAALRAWSAGQTAAANRVTQFAFDQANRQTYTIDAEGYVTAFTYDPANRIVATVQYVTAYVGPAGRTSAQLDGWASTRTHADDRITRTLYDAAGRVAFQIDAEGYVTAMTYDASGLMTAQHRFDDKYTGAATHAALKTWSGDELDAATITSYTYDAAGRTQTTTDALGVVTHFALDGLGQPLEISRRSGSTVLSLTERKYDLGGRLTSETRGFGSPQATETKWTYDGLGRVLGTTDGRGSTTLREYDAEGRVLNVTVPLTVAAGANPATNAVTTYTYDAFGNVKTVVDPRGGTGYFFYNKIDQLERQVDPGGYVTKTTYTRGGEVASVTVYATALTALQLAAIPDLLAHQVPVPTGYLDQDAVTTFTRDRLDRLTCLTDAHGHDESYTLNAFGERRAVTDRRDFQTTYVYDRLGRMTSTIQPVTLYNADGTVRATTVTNNYSYDGHGNLTKTVEASGLSEARTTEYRYDRLNRLIETLGDWVVVTSATDFTTTTTVRPTETIVYDLRGNVSETVNAAGARTLFFYDNLDRKELEWTEVQTASGVRQGVVKSWVYDKNGNATEARVFDALAAMPTGANRPATTGAARLMTYGYDLNNRQISATTVGLSTVVWTDGAFTTTTAPITTTTQYDAVGNVVLQTDGRGGKVFSYYDAVGRMTHRVDAGGYLTVWERDADGNAKRETRYADPVTGTLSVSRAVNTLAPTTNAAENRITDFTYDRNGRRTAEKRLNVVAYTIDANGVMSTATTVNSEIKYDYDALGNVTRRTEANLDVTDYQYDALGRLILETGATISDHNNQSVRRETITHYDGLGSTLRTLVGTQGSTAGRRVTTMTYDDGRLTSVEDASGFVRKFGYDVAGRMVTETYNRLTMGGEPDEGRRYVYDTAGRLVDQASAWRPKDGTTLLDWTFDADGSGTADSLFSSQIAYNAHGEVVSRGVNGGAQETYAYDAGGRMWRSSAGDGVTRFYAYDAAGNATLTVASTGTDLSAHDDLGDILALVPASGVMAQGAVATFTTYDLRGLALSTVEPGRQLSRDLTVANGAYTTATITRARSYNAFGEVNSETDARLNTTTFAYNTLGRLTTQTGPVVSYTTEIGQIVTDAAPVQQTYYDVSGRLVATRDAEGNLNRRALLAGSGHGGTEALVTARFDAAGTDTASSGITRYGYNVFGDLRQVTDALQGVELRGYDAMGRVTQINHVARASTSPGGATQLIDHYTYDGLGQRIAHTNSVFGSDVKEITDYDRDGRVIRTTDFEGRITTTGYVWDATLTTTGLGTFGGWIKSTTNTADRTGVERLDLFGRLVGKTDLGGRTYAMTFDRGGRLVTQTSSRVTNGVTETLQSIGYGWYNTGLMAEMDDRMGDALTFVIRGTDPYDGVHTTGLFAYDASGNRVAERYESTTYAYGPTGELNGQGQPIWELSQDTVVHQDGQADYDALNRMTAFRDLSVSSADPTLVAYTYDLNGNVRSVAARYRPIGAVSPITAPTLWYRYDAMNRFVTVKGVLTNGVIVRGASGADLSYDALGNRTAQITNDQTETYEYSADGYLQRVLVGGVERAQDWRDAMGRLVRHEEYSPGTGLTYSRVAAYDRASLLTSETTVTFVDAATDHYVRAQTAYDYRLAGAGGASGGTYDGDWMGVVTRATTTSAKGASAAGTFDDALPTSRTTHGYQWWSDARQASITHDPDIATGGVWTSSFVYDPNGKLARVTILDGNPRTVSYVTDLQGQVLTRRESDHSDPAAPMPRDAHFYFNGVRVGSVTNDAGWDDSYTEAATRRRAPDPAGAFVRGTGPTPGTDFDQAYEGLTPGSVRATGSSYSVNDGDTLQSIATAAWGDASLWYLIADANGLTSASLLTAGQVLTLPANTANVHNTSETFRPYDPNKAIGDVNPTQPKPPAKAGGCGTVGTVIAIVIAAVVVALVAPYASAALSNVMSGVGGSLFSVGTGAATTAVASSVASWSVAGAVAGGALAGAAGAIASQAFQIATGAQDRFDWKGVALSALSGGVGGGLSQVTALTNAMGTAGQIGQAGLRGGIGSVVTQGVAVATGLQDQFSWTSVAVSAVTSAVGRGLDMTFGVSNGPISQWKLDDYAGSAASGAISGAVGAATQSLLDGTSFGDNYRSVLPQVIGSTIGNMIAGQVLAAGRNPYGQRDTDSGSSVESYGRSRMSNAGHPTAMMAAMPFGSPLYMSGNLGAQSEPTDFGDWIANTLGGALEWVGMEPTQVDDIIVIGRRFVDAHVEGYRWASGKIDDARYGAYGLIDRAAATSIDLRHSFVRTMTKPGDYVVQSVANRLDASGHYGLAQETRRAIILLRETAIGLTIDGPTNLVRDMSKAGLGALVDFGPVGRINAIVENFGGQIDGPNANNVVRPVAEKIGGWVSDPGSIVTDLRSGVHNSLERRRASYADMASDDPVRQAAGARAFGDQTFNDLTVVVPAGGAVFKGMKGFDALRAAGTLETGSGKFITQGFNQVQAEYLAKPYPRTLKGHHSFITQKMGRNYDLPRWLVDSPLNVLKPHGISRGDFYELHYKVDPTFHNANFPKSIGGRWTGSALGIEKYTGVERIWHMSPAPLKVTVGGAAFTGGVGTYYYFGDEK